MVFFSSFSCCVASWKSCRWTTFEIWWKTKIQMQWYKNYTFKNMDFCKKKMKDMIFKVLNSLLFSIFCVSGFFALVISLLMLGAAVYFKCPVTKVMDKFFRLMTTAVVFSFILSICLYVKSTFVSSKKLAAGGNTGNLNDANLFFF